MRQATMRRGELSRRGRGGFLVMDAVAGILLAMVLLMVMTSAVIKQARREKEFAEIRAASRAAEGAMLSLEAGAPLPAGATVERVAGAAPAGLAWARVTMKKGSHRGRVVGLVKERRLGESGVGR